MDEQQTIRLAQKGDLAAFNRLVLAYQGLAFNVAYRIIGDTEGASDACQEAFISAFKNLKAYRGGVFKSWLMRIVTNSSYDQMRYKMRRPAASLENSAEDPYDSLQLVSKDESPEEHALRRELSRALQDCIERLPGEYRPALVLCDVQDFSYEEIAEITGVSLGTVKSRLSRARSRMRDCLSLKGELLPQYLRLTNRADRSEEF
jgi:RNA polymerase sigma-70 factor, ECF subfamily